MRVVSDSHLVSSAPEWPAERRSVVSVAPKVSPRTVTADSSIALCNLFVETECAPEMMPASKDKLDDSEPTCTPAVAIMDRDLARLGVGKQFSEESETHIDAWAAVEKMR